MNKYAFTGFEADTMARASMRDVAISFKSSIILSQKLRGMMSDKALTYLEAVAEKKQAVPFTRFRDGAGHKPGIGAGKFPVKAALSFAELIKLGVANAENKGLGTPLRIVHVLANEGSRPMRPGRDRGKLMKRTHIELVLAETEESKKREKKPKKAPAKKAEPKAEVKAEPKADAKPAPKTEEKQAEKQAPKVEEKKPEPNKEAPETPKSASEPPAQKKEEPKPKEAVKNGN